MIEYDTLKYTKIEVSPDLLESFEEEGFTYLHCTYKTSPKYSKGWWININNSSYITGGKDLECLKMLNAIGIPLAPEKHYLKKFGDTLKFTLIFPAIPKDWKTFDFIEDTNPTYSVATIQLSHGLSIRNITRNNTGVYKVIIQ